MAKRTWVKHHFNIPPDRVLTVKRRQKQLFASKGNILIDDYIKNCQEFNIAGGSTIHHKSIANTLTILQKT